MQAVSAAYTHARTRTHNFGTSSDMATDESTESHMERLPVLYSGYTMAEFRCKMRLPEHLYSLIYENGMELSAGDGMRWLMVPRCKRPDDPDDISVEDLDAIAEGTPRHNK